MSTGKKAPKYKDPYVLQALSDHARVNEQHLAKEIWSENRVITVN